MEIGDKVNPYELGQRSFNPKEIFTFLKHPNHRIVVWSWGAHAWTTHEDKFLRFMVQGRLFRGHVYITLAWDDTFTLYFTTSRGTVKQIITDVYIDCLVDIIDTTVETPR